MMEKKSARSTQHPFSSRRKTSGRGPNRARKIFELWSEDGGKTWGKMTLTTIA